MQINNQTKYEAFVQHEKYVTKEAETAIMKAAEAQFVSMYDLTFAQFHACYYGDFAEVLGDLSNPTVFQIYWCKRFGDFVKDYAENLKRLQLPPTTDEKKANKGLLITDWAEGILVFVRDYFGLPSFKEAEKITLGEILIAKRARYNDDLFRRNLAQIRTAKIQKK